MASTQIPSPGNTGFNNGNGMEKRKNGEWIIIKNLDKTLTSEDLHKTFEMFGPIISCTVPTDEHGVSEGYGIIQFETEDAAAATIRKVNGLALSNQTLYVGYLYLRKGEMDSTNDLAGTSTTNNNVPAPQS